MRDSIRRDLRWVRAFRRAVIADLTTLSGLVTEELGKLAFEVLTSEVLPLVQACRWHERHAAGVLRPRRLRGGSVFQLGQRHVLRRVPLGEVAIVATWNYPLQLLGVQLVQAVVTGNRVVVKPSERAPRSQTRLLELAREAGLDERRLRWTAGEREAGERLLAEERFDHVVFTGSSEVGRQIARTLAETLTPSTLELSGHDSALVLSDADPDLAARSIWFAVQLNGGATCMAPRRVIADSAIRHAFLEAFRRCAQAKVDVTGYREAEHARAFALAKDAVERGGTWLLADMANPGWPGVRVVVDAPEESQLSQGSHFGPALAFMSAKHAEDVLSLYRRFDQRLATAVFTSSPARSREWSDDLDCSAVTFNDCVLPTAHPAAHLGGRGPSGWGVSQGRLGLEAMTRPVVVSRTSRWLRPPTDPPGDVVQRRFARFVRWWYG